MTPPSGNENGANQMTPPSGNENGTNQMTPPNMGENNGNQMVPPDRNNDMMWGNEQGKQNPFDMSNGGQTQANQGFNPQNIMILLSCLGVMIVATVVVIYYKRRKFHT